MVAMLVGACGGSSGDDAVDGTALPSTLLPGTTTTLPVATTAPPATTSTTTSTTTTSTTLAPATTAPPTAVTTTVAPFAELVMSSTGIGAAQFSAEPEGVISYITSFLGEPTGDTGWIDPFTIGSCPGTELRLVSWGVLNLTFGDVSQVLQGRRHFYAFELGDAARAIPPPPGMATAEGITVGSRVVDLLAAYPGVVLNSADDFSPSNFVVNDNFRGFLTGLADESTVSVIFGGQGCGGI